MSDIQHAESFSKRILRKGAWMYIFTILAAPFAYFTRVILARDLSLADFGILYGIVGLLGFLLVYSDFGFSESLNYFLPQKVFHKDKKGFARFLLYAIVVQFLGTLAISVLIFCFAGQLAHWPFHAIEARGVIQIFAVFVFGYGFLHVPMAALNAVQEVKIARGVELLRTTLIFVGVLLLFLVHQGTLHAYAWTWVISLILGVFVYWFFLLSRLRPYFDFSEISWNRKEFGHILRYAFWSVLANNVGTLLSYLDSFFVIALLGNEANGIYSNYLSLMSIPFLVVGPAMAFLFPIFSELSAKNDAEKILRVKSIAYQYLISGGVFLGAILAVTGPHIATLLYGEVYRASGELMAWSAPFLVFNFLLQMNFQLIAGTGRAKIRMLILLASIVVNITVLLCLFGGIPFPGGNLIFWKGIGLPAAALASGFGWVFIFLCAAFVTRNYAVTIPWTNLVKNIGATLVLVAISLGAQSFFPATDTIHRILLLALTFLLAILLWAWVNFSDAKSVFRELRALVPTKKQKHLPESSDTTNPIL